MNYKINLFKKSSSSTDLQSGQFLIEIVIAVAVLLMLAHAFFTLITTSYQILAQSRAQTIARALANEKMELIRNLPYDSIGTVGGIPNGSIPQTENVLRNDQTFTVKSSIIYKDDPFDGLAPMDLLPIDYKNARIDVTWTTTFPTQQTITLLTDIAPSGVETTNGGGTISLLVFDSQGQPVPQSTVQISAPNASPPISLEQVTDNYGNLVLPGAPVCTACYNITVTKSGYSTSRTYTTVEVPNPAQPPLTVLEGQITQNSFAIDHLANVTITSHADRSLEYEYVPNASFHLQSSKTIGTDADSNPVYKVDQNYSTDSSGNISLTLEWDSYALSVNDEISQLGGSNPQSPIAITAGANTHVKFVSINQSPHSLLLKVQDASGSAIASASARLFDGISFEETIFTGESDTPDFGQAYFSALSPADYNLELIHPDFETTTSPITINGQMLETIVLNEP